MSARKLGGRRAIAGVAGGSVFASPGWAAHGAPQFDVDATAGAARLSVTRWGV